MDRRAFSNLVERVLGITGKMEELKFSYEGKDYVLHFDIHTNHLPQEVIISEKKDGGLTKICSMHIQDELSLYPGNFYEWINIADAFRYNKLVSKSETNLFI